VKQRQSVLGPIVFLLIGVVLWALAMWLTWQSSWQLENGGSQARKTGGRLQIASLALLGCAGLVFLPGGVGQLARLRRTPLELAL
jgi:hypothetical protein